MALPIPVPQPSPWACRTPCPQHTLSSVPPQLQINTWFIANRDPKTGEYPDLPPEEDGGSTPILNPPPPSVESLLAAQQEQKGAAGKGKPAAAAKPGEW